MRRVLFYICILGGLLHFRIASEVILPEIGTTAGNILSIDQEKILGDIYVRRLRNDASLIHDPLLDYYINELGQRLVSHAQSVRTFFHFYLMCNEHINAFAFFGGNVVLHSALFRYTDNESQLASVIAHEVSHVTQRHLARALEKEKQNSPLMLAGSLGSVLLMMTNPQLGMAVFSTTVAGSSQSAISFTQQNEQEADRIGLSVLQRASFDPHAMPDFLQKLANMELYASKPPEMLLTHPLPVRRLVDIRNRASQLPSYTYVPSLNYQLAKIRTLVMYDDIQVASQEKNQAIIKKMEKGNNQEQQAAIYGRVILLQEKRKYDEARLLLQPLLDSQVDNIWYIDLMSDIDLGEKKIVKAIQRLTDALKKNIDNPVLLIKLAHAYIINNQSDKALNLLYRYTYRYSDDFNGWTLLAKASSVKGFPGEALAAQAENFALKGQLSTAISMLSHASTLVKEGTSQQARYDARIDQLRGLQETFKNIRKIF